ncbi:trehalose 6-phosphate synthase [Motilibacter peucedani]|uniref:Trehalose 6-phosphate synthase n=1 Tax=Motilibacter peucedani TaxID=598650 RepID=A0A420XK43_9ACTN|nr:trehalose-6-phosphate synthase [Motilibacter peucedani]RKS68492.1 trehalose 6-phosphate synthase [Motilibacter peucedani]
MAASLLVASNRGPLSFHLDAEGRPRGRRGGGGLVSALSSAGRDTSSALWVCTALTEADRQAVQGRPRGRIDAGDEGGGLAVRMLAEADGIDAHTFSLAYNAVANSTLWFVHHRLYATPTAPVFDAGFTREWAAYSTFNRAFAAALAEEAAPGAKVLVQDYHLTLTPRMLRDRRPDLRIAHFSHTPWAPADYFSMLPAEIAREVLLGVLGADEAGFLAPRWAEAFLDCCERVLGARVERHGTVHDDVTSDETDGGTVTWEGRRTRVTVHALGIDADELCERGSRPDVISYENAMRARIGDRLVIARVDRTELSKNIVRGLLAYRELLRRHPEWVGRVVHVAGAYPSRHDLPEYREYTAHVQRLAAEIDEEFAFPGWSPLLLTVDDDYPRSLATYRLADVLLVNPVRDGMNLVAKEGPLLSQRHAVLVLSTEAGAAHELGEHALLVNPFDVSGTATALHRALTMEPAERERRSAGLVAAAGALPPHEWLEAQLRGLDTPA